MTTGQEFYMFRNNSAHMRGFTWAWRYEPRSEMIHRECPEVGVVVNYPSGAFDVVVEGGIKYPDVLGCGEYPFLIVSEAVIHAWQESSITCFHTYPVHVIKTEMTKKLRDVMSPQYYRVEIDGRCRIDLTASGLKVIRYIPECHYLKTEPSVASGFQIIPGSWDGSPLFRDVELFPRVSFCTKQVLEIARRYQLTNFRFEPMAGPRDSFSKGIDYLGKRRIDE